ncbi:MAG: hypothetical protein MZU79_04810 [Anaerotruncus sp.]|nr:hypothetical protein [Anaerotruncus sp.]
MKKVLIMGAAGRDFHNFNTYFRDNPDYRVVAFTATQIPDIEGRKYPAVLAGKLYPKGIPIEAESELDRLIADYKVDDVHLAYSDLPHAYVMDKASQVQAAGANFVLLGPDDTMIKSRKPVVSVCAVRTGSGKSQTSRRVAEILQKPRAAGSPPSATPCPTATWSSRRSSASPPTPTSTSTSAPSRSARSTSPTSTRASSSTPASITAPSSARPRRKPTSSSGTAATTTSPSTSPTSRSSSPTRTGPATSSPSTPATTNFRRAKVIVINKMDTATPEGIETVLANAKKVNPKATIIRANSPTIVEDGGRIARQARPGHRGRTDPDPRRHEVRRRHRRGPEVRRGRDHRPPALRRRLDQEDLREVQPPRQRPAGHGLRRQADPRAGQDHRGHRLRLRRQRDADRHHPGHQGLQAHPPRRLRARGDRHAHAQGRPEEVLEAR